MGKFNGKKQKFTKESYESLRKKKIETARYKKHKMLKKYEKLCIAEGITSSSRVHIGDGADKEETPSVDDSDAPGPTRPTTDKREKVVKKKQPFAREMQIAAQRRSEINNKREEAGKRESEINSLRKDREHKANRYRNRVKQGKLGLGKLSLDLLSKIEKPTSS